MWEDVGRYEKIWEDMGRYGKSQKKKYKKIAALQFRVWSPTTLLSATVTRLTTVDRTGNGVFWYIWPQPILNKFGHYIYEGGRGCLALI